MTTNSLERDFKKYILQEALFNAGDKLLLAVSGGVDSIVLCHLCKATGFDFQIAHCNFRLRGSESEKDAGFVRQLAAKMNVIYHEQAFDTQGYAALHKVSTQVAARELRYAWFNDLIRKDGGKALRYVVTAHHADDNVETMLMHFFKGTGVNGLKGIMPKEKNLVRPLLFAKKEALISYAATHALDYREDASNALDKYTRNYFRNTLIPSIEKVFPAVTDNLVDNAKRFRDIRLLYKQAVASQIKKLVFVKENEVHIPVLKLSKTEASATILFEIIKPFNFSAGQLKDVMHLLQSTTGKFVNSPSHRIFRFGKWLIISTLGNDGGDNFLVDAQMDTLRTSTFSLEFTKRSVPVEITKGSAVALLDLKNIRFPLIVRKWKPGDYFYPLGMRKKKKVGRFLSDSKLSLPEKENTWVIESERKIIWIVGKRIDDRFKIEANTTDLLKINWLPAK